MKVLMIARSTLYTGSGGDTTQVTQTAAYLRKLNIEVDICLANESINYSTYDLIHFFNIIRPGDILLHKNKSGLPYVVSTIYVDYSSFEKKNRSWLFSMIHGLMGKENIEYLKALARHIKGNEKLVSPTYWIKGHKSSVCEIIKGAKLLLPNSEHEYQRVCADYGLQSDYAVIPNAIDKAVFEVDFVTVKREGLLCVGRIEHRKNQLAVIRAANKMGVKLTIIGKPAPNQMEYYKKCKSEAGDAVEFFKWVSEEELVKAYQTHKVHVLASWFETTGLVSLEAAVLGCNIVITEMGDTREYFGEYAFYCHPNSIVSIQRAIEKALLAEEPETFRKIILDKYTWEQTAHKTLIAYKKALADD